jgi:hypothetical protein
MASCLEADIRINPYARRSELSLFFFFCAPLTKRLSFLRPILPLRRRRHRSAQACGQEGDQAPNRPVHVGEVLRVSARRVGVGQDIGQDTDDELEPPIEFSFRRARPKSLSTCSSRLMYPTIGDFLSLSTPTSGVASESAAPFLTVQSASPARKTVESPMLPSGLPGRLPRACRGRTSEPQAGQWNTPSGRRRISGCPHSQA